MTFLGSPYFSPDMGPVNRAGRRWGMKDIAVLWISMSACIPTYMLASGLINGGMNWWQAVLTIFLGNVIVLVPMVLNAHAGTKYGIPFPVYCRAQFRHSRGERSGAAAGARRLRLVRHSNLDRRRGAFIAFSRRSFPLGRSCPIFGEPGVANSGINAAQFGCFLAFWLVNMLVIYMGIESIRILLNIKAPLLIILGLLLLAWAYIRAGGFGDDACASLRSSTRGSRKKGSFGVFSSSR